MLTFGEKKNPDTRLFTFLNNSQQIHSRIDRIYIKNNQKIINTSIIPTGLSGHYAVMVNIQIKKDKYFPPKVTGNLILQFQKKKTFKNFLNYFGKIDKHKKINIPP